MATLGDSGNGSLGVIAWSSALIRYFGDFWNNRGHTSWRLLGMLGGVVGFDRGMLIGLYRRGF